MKMNKYLVLFTLLVFITNCETFFELVGADVGSTDYTQYDYCLSNDKVICYQKIYHDAGYTIKHKCWDNFDIVNKCSKDSIDLVCHTGGIEEVETYTYYYSLLLDYEKYTSPFDSKGEEIEYSLDEYLELINTIDIDNNEKCAKTFGELEKIVSPCN